LGLLRESIDGSDFKAESARAYRLYGASRRCTVGAATAGSVPAPGRAAAAPGVRTAPHQPSPTGTSPVACPAGLAAWNGIAAMRHTHPTTAHRRARSGRWIRCTLVGWDRLVRGTLDLLNAGRSPPGGAHSVTACVRGVSGMYGAHHPAPYFPSCQVGGATVGPKRHPGLLDSNGLVDDRGGSASYRSYPICPSSPSSQRRRWGLTCDDDGGALAWCVCVLCSFPA